MARRKGKSVSFDAMVKFFMQYYNIPTKKDIIKLIERMDRLEQVIKESELSGKGSRSSTSASRPAKTSSNRVLEVIKRFKKGVGFTEIQKRTGYGEKKLRNIIYRLHKTKQIYRKSRGVYIAS